MNTIEIEKPMVKLDPFCVEKNLTSWASSRIISRGRDYYRKGNVLSLEFDGSHKIEAQVQGTAVDPYALNITFDEFGMPVSKCSCPFTWEPLCKHAVAVLIAWQQEETGSEPVLGKEDDSVNYVPLKSPAQRENYLQELAQIERAERETRCTEQGLRIMARPKRGLLGTYIVSSGNPNRKIHYDVTVRDAQWQHASCACVDYRTNELGTCKHIELVKKSLGSRRTMLHLTELERKSRLVSIYLGTRETHNTLVHPTEAIRLYRSPSLQNMDTFFKSTFDPNGFLKNGQTAEEQSRRFEHFLKRLEKDLRGVNIHVDSGVTDLLRKEGEASHWEKKIEALAQTRENHSAWAKSVGEMGVRLHPYQVEGILFAAKKRRAFIGDDMGLGKTIQAIGASLLLKELGQVKRVVVISPASLKFQWAQEIQKVSKASVLTMSGSARERDEKYRKSQEFFMLLNYELLYRDLDQILGLKADLIILDEAQRIKNWETKIAQAIKRLESPYRFVLTGTPLENRLPEFHSIVEFLDPQALGAAWKLIPTYADFDEEDNIVGYSRLDHLKKRTSRFFIRRTRQEVLSQLPKRTDNNFWTRITSDQASVHDELGKRVTFLMKKWSRFGRLTREDMQRLFMYLTCMRIVSNAYGQYDWKKIQHKVLSAKNLTPGLKKEIGSPKLEEFRNVVEDLLEVSGQKLVIFSQWERMIRLAELYTRDLLEAKRERSVIFCGSLSMKKREATIKQFLMDPRTRVFFSTDSGAVGLNLQEAANCVINLEIPWNPAVLEQRVGRVHRMGQKKSVQVMNFISSESVEERIFAQVKNKKALFAGVFDADIDKVRFNKDQAASFMDKMKLIVPEDSSSGEEGGLSTSAENEVPSELEALVVSDQILPEKGSGLEATRPDPFSTPAVVDGQPGNGHSTVGVSADGLSAAGQLNIDLGSLASVFSNLLADTKGGASTPLANLSLKVSEDPNHLHISIPKPAVDILKGLRPLFEALIKIGVSETTSD